MAVSSALDVSRVFWCCWLVFVVGECTYGTYVAYHCMYIVLETSQRYPLLDVSTEICRNLRLKVDTVKTQSLKACFFGRSESLCPFILMWKAPNLNLHHVVLSEEMKTEILPTSCVGNFRTKKFERKNREVLRACYGRVCWCWMSASIILPSSYDPRRRIESKEKNWKAVTVRTSKGRKVVASILSLTLTTSVPVRFRVAKLEDTEIWSKVSHTKESHIRGVLGRIILATWIQFEVRFLRWGEEAAFVSKQYPKPTAVLIWWSESECSSIWLKKWVLEHVLRIDASSWKRL